MNFYVIKPDDTLQRLSSRYYGDWKLWMLLWDYNSHILTDRFNLDVGVKIAIPDIPTSEQTHRVMESDSYGSISKQYYSSEHFSEKIKAKNGYLRLSENINKNIVIPSLVDQTVYQNIKSGDVGETIESVKVIVQDDSGDYNSFVNEFKDGLL